MESKSSARDTAGTIPKEFQNILKEMKFPIKRNDLVDKAKGKVSDETLEDLGMLPDKQYSSADEVMKAYEERVSKAAR
ncbi:MAG TPA: DUF2795 domain-containing protein [Bacteroidales bacterium]|nr:DUF2795 domain-containing protein [Bacteroidales bacterium]